jgi:DNA-binding HxlR family transcriptional regulator
VANPQTKHPYDLIDDAQCRGFQEHLEVVGRRWNSGILLAGVRGAVRFSEYRTMVAGISDRLLTQRLKELEQQGFMSRTVIPTTPVTVNYELTTKGRELMRALEPIVQWTQDQLTSSKSLTTGLRAVEAERTVKA